MSRRRTGLSRGGSSEWKASARERNAPMIVDPFGDPIDLRKPSNLITCRTLCPKKVRTSSGSTVLKWATLTCFPNLPVAEPSTARCQAVCMVGRKPMRSKASLLRLINVWPTSVPKPMWRGGAQAHLCGAVLLRAPKKQSIEIYFGLDVTEHRDVSTRPARPA